MRFELVRLASDPGTAFLYSNANYHVLGHVIERASGKPFGSYVSDEIFAPLGMDDSHVDIDEATDDGLTDAHRFWFGIPEAGVPLWRPDLMPAGWLISSADDLGRFLAANLDGGALDGVRLFSAEGIATMHHGAVEAGRASYGMGWFDGAIGSTRVVSHSGSTTDMASAMYLAPERGVGIVVLYNGQSLVYELLHKGEAIAEAAMAKLLGEPAGGTLGALYPAFTVAVVRWSSSSSALSSGRLAAAEPTCRSSGRSSAGARSESWPQPGAGWSSRASCSGRRPTRSAHRGPSSSTSTSGRRSRPTPSSSS